MVWSDDGDDAGKDAVPVDDAGESIAAFSEFDVVEKAEIPEGATGEKKDDSSVHDDAGESSSNSEATGEKKDDSSVHDDAGESSSNSSEFEFVEKADGEVPEGATEEKKESLLSYLARAANLKYDEFSVNNPIITTTFVQMEEEAWEEIIKTASTVGAAVIAYGIICLIRQEYTAMGALAYLFKRGLMQSPLMAGPKRKVESFTDEIKEAVKKWVREAVSKKRKFSADDLTDEDILRIFERHAALIQAAEDEAEATRRSWKGFKIDRDYISRVTSEAELEILGHHSAGSTSRVFWLDSHGDLESSISPGFSFSTTEEFWRLFLERLPRKRELRRSSSAADECELKEERPSKQRLLVVANRLPVSAVRKGEDSWQLELSVGGLMSALLGVKEFDVRLIGWAGVNVPDSVGQNALTEALAEKRCIPVFLAEETVNKYNSSCNNILWPLFHHLGLPQEDLLASTQSFQSQFDAYKKANQIFADVVNKHYKDGDIVWCHGYQLMFLPKCLKEHNGKMRVGWFLHSPFPESEMHWTLPYQSELLKAVLAADLVGFCTYDYERHFVSACTRILGLEGTPEGVKDQGRLTRVAAFPIGIDSDQFIRALEDPDVQEHMREFKERFAGRKVMLGVDRLDMIKGIRQKMLAFEKFLEKNPDQCDKVVLVQIAVPTGTDVPEYQKLTSQVHEIVGRINGRFGTPTAVPIHHLDQSLDFHALCALYAVTDVALFTSLMDGTNLASYEFISCQASKKGVLILNEFAAAAQSFGAEAILVNPWDITEFAALIGSALNMPTDDREKHYHCNSMHVTTHRYQKWAATFVSELNNTIAEAQSRARQVPPLLTFKGSVDRYFKSDNQLLILGFNATLTEPKDTCGRRGGQIREMELKLHPDLKEPLKRICNDPKTTVVVLDGCVLDYNFGDYNMWLAAEKGMFLRLTTGEWMTTMPENLNMDWVDSVKHVFEHFTERTPGSHFELRESSLIWNCNNAEIEFGKLQGKDLLQHLWTGPISNACDDVVQGGRSVKGAGKIVYNNGMQAPIDCVLCVGHFLPKDEDLLKSSDDVVTPLKELDEGGEHADPEPSNSEGGALSPDSED